MNSGNPVELHSHVYSKSKVPAFVLSTATRRDTSFTPGTSASEVPVHVPSTPGPRVMQTEQLPLKMIISDMARRSSAKRSSPELTSQHEGKTLIEHLIAEPVPFETIKQSYELSTLRPSKRIRKDHDAHLLDASVYTSQLIGKQRFLLPWNKDSDFGKENQHPLDFDAENKWNTTFNLSDVATSREFSNPQREERFKDLYGHDFQVKTGPFQAKESCGRILQTRAANFLNQELKKCNVNDTRDNVSPAASAVQKPSTTRKASYVNDTLSNFTKTSEFVKPKVMEKSGETVYDIGSCPTTEYPSPLVTATESSSSQNNTSKLCPQNPALKNTVVNKPTKNINVSFQSYCYNFLTLMSNVNEELQESRPIPPKDSQSDESFEDLQERVLRNTCFSNTESPRNSEEEIFTDEEE